MNSFRHLVLAVAVLFFCFLGRAQEEENIVRITGNASQLDLKSDVDAVKGIFNAAPRGSNVSLMCLESNGELLQPGPYEPAACSNQSRLADQKYEVTSGVPYVLLRNFGINTREWTSFQDGTFSQYNYVLDSAAHQVIQAFEQFETSGGFHKWHFKAHQFPDRVQFKAPGTGPHIHIGVAYDNPDRKPVFIDGQSRLDLHAKVAVPKYVKSSEVPHSSLTLVVGFHQKKMDNSGNKALTLHLKVFWDLYDGHLVEGLGSDGRNTYLKSLFHPDATYGTNMRSTTRSEPFSGVQNFRFSIGREHATRFLEDFNDRMDANGTPEEKVKTTDFSEFYIKNFSIRNESQKLYGEELEIHIEVDAIKIIRVY